MTDGNYISQLTGAVYQRYYFYRNWIGIFDKYFASPIGTSWRAIYNYELDKQRHFIDGDSCYRIFFKPKRKEDLAFTGSMWITKDHYALKQIDAQTQTATNINFIEKIQIQMTLRPADEHNPDGVWVSDKTRVILNVSELSKDLASVIVKFYLSKRNYILDQAKEDKFYATTRKVIEGAKKIDEQYWRENRHEKLSDEEINMYNAVDSIKNFPRIRTLSGIITALFTGNFEPGKKPKIGIGPYTNILAVNDIEGSRLNVGFRTTSFVSEKLNLNGNLIYGTGDKRLKYKLRLKYNFSKTPWKQVGLEHSYDLEQVGLYDSDTKVSDVALQVNAINASLRWGTLNRPFYHTLSRIWYASDWFSGFEQKAILTHKVFKPVFDFWYGVNGERQRTFDLLEGTLSFRTAIGLDFINNYGDRTLVRTAVRPVIQFNYSYGFDTRHQSAINYHKLYLGLYQQMRVGILGNLSYQLEGAYIFGALPYPLLINHLGNQKNSVRFFNPFSFNLMHPSEFVSDQFVSFRAKHAFDGILFNTIPLIKKLGLRAMLIGNVLYGNMSQENRTLNSLERGGQAFYTPNNIPYVEVGYGVENILKILQVYFLHRITYLDNPNADRFGIFFSTMVKI